MKNPLDLTAAQLTGNFIKVPYDNSDSLFTSCLAFWKHLHLYDSVDVLTFTVDSRACRQINIKRLICTKAPNIPLQGVKVRLVVNNHAKVYICYTGKRFETFVGSYNLVRPTYLEVIIKAGKEESKRLKSFYETVWDLADPS